ARSDEGPGAGGGASLEPEHGLELDALEGGELAADARDAAQRGARLADEEPDGLVGGVAVEHLPVEEGLEAPEGGRVLEAEGGGQLGRIEEREIIFALVPGGGLLLGLEPIAMKACCLDAPGAHDAAHDVVADVVV